MGPFPFQIATGLNVGHLNCIYFTQYLTAKKTWGILEGQTNWLQVQQWGCGYGTVQR